MAISGLYLIIMISTRDHFCALWILQNTQLRSIAYYDPIKLELLYTHMPDNERRGNIEEKENEAACMIRVKANEWHRRMALQLQ